MAFIDELSYKHKLSLNEQQKQAVTHFHGPALVLAGPGSGKTTVITARTAWLIFEAGVKPDSILTMTFNKAAKHEMETRFRKLFGRNEVDKVYFSTLHSFCNMVVRDYEKRQGKRLKRIEGSSEDEENKHKIVRSIYNQVSGTVINDDELENLINEMGLVKNKMIKDIDNHSFSRKSFSQVYKAYEEYKKSNLMMDFDDMLTYAYSVLNRCPDILQYYRRKYRYIQVDEGQDLSKIQFEIIKLLVQDNGDNLFIVADDDQSIYGFRGAEPQYILDIEKQFSECIIYRLEKNYRSTRNIVEISSNFIKSNKFRYDKNHEAVNDYIQDPFIIKIADEREQLKFLIDKIKSINFEKRKGDIAILYRNNLSSILVADALERNGIRFRIRQNRLFFFNHWIVLDILAFLKFSLDQRDLDSFNRICFKMKRYISKAMMENVQHAEIKDSVIDALLSGVELQSYHRNRIAELKREFVHLGKLQTAAALNYIEKKFNYFDSVNEYCEATGLSFDYLHNLFDKLLTLASYYPSIPSFLQRVSELELVLGNSPPERAEGGVILTTIHSSKGLEYDNVLMIDLTNDEFPGSRALEQKETGNAKLIEEERRLFYVGMTRARKYLWLVSPIKRNNESAARSVFINEVSVCINGQMLNDIGEGMLIKHKHFGEGFVIAFFEQNHGRTIVEIDFKGMRRKLDFDTCVENGLLSW